ncbi:MAG: ABC transporter permease [Actinomycetota bacterium]
MPAVWLRLRADGRKRRRAWLALAVLIGLGGGVVMASLSGAQRTETAFDRFLEWSDAADVVLFNAADPVDFDEVRKLPEVDSAVNAWFVWMIGSEGHSLLDPIFTDGPGLDTVDRPKLLAGRRPDPAKVDEAAITPVAARITGLTVGSRVTLDSLAPDQLEQAFEGPDLEPAGPTVTFRIVGIQAMRGEFVHDASIHLTPAFGRAYADRVATIPLLAVNLRRGAADQSSFKAGVERIAGGSAVTFDSTDEGAAEVNRTLRIQSVALRIFALLAGVACAVILGQALARDVADQSVDHVPLRAIGMTRFQMWAASVLRVAVIGVAGAAVAAVVAFALAPVTVFGLAREVDPDPGTWFDPTAVLGGAAAVLAVTVLVVSLPAWRATRSADERLQTPAGGRAVPSRAVAGLARAGLPASAVAGVRMAVEPGRGRSAVPTRAALVGTTVSLAALVMALTFGASLDRLLHTPRLYGWNWDAVVGSPFDEDVSDKVVPALAAEPSVAEFSSVKYAEMEVGGTRVRTFGFDTVRGSVLPPITAGRAPQGPDEIVLGAKTLRQAGRSVGGLVEVRVGERRSSMRIVGRGVLPGLGESDEGGLGEGAFVTQETLDRLVPRAPANLFIVRYSDQVPGAVAESALEVLGYASRGAEPPAGVADFGRVDKLPGVLSALLVLVAVGTLGHTLLTGVRRRRRDLAILKTLGFVRRQVVAAVAWQATTLVGVALLFGLPAGLASGRWAWRGFAGELGIVPQPVVPLVSILLVVPAALLVANLLAALPGRSAAGTRPALVLRSE